ncbi:YqaE/Pmp3 family membrane protein [Sphingomonas nostoxanthinifaciens]|uniref:YqaE/Pmp3 family membrane protein n=1 Tax=Sphingomonas nostoxanthinifaciens TaxID=2872652 RepID=UPI001CC21186|nr:YqaE/Pmp3 family membrane protein [Sphingomonas nostoxanthinifaciens]UAK24468.1 YqaE/Pmp3 family membrane protein [Sphingomonas nostoxanthinifaciens]
MPREAGIGAIVAAILLPPLGIFLVRGLGTEFWIGVVLTLLGWVPGVIFALVAILRPAPIARA